MWSHISNPMNICLGGVWEHTGREYGFHEHAFLGCLVAYALHSCVVQEQLGLDMN